VPTKPIEKAFEALKQSLPIAALDSITTFEMHDLCAYIEADISKSALPLPFVIKKPLQLAWTFTGTFHEADCTSFRVATPPF
jgi:hypothetical protein